MKNTWFLCSDSKTLFSIIMDIAGRTLVKHFFTDRIPAVREAFMEKINSLEEPLELVYQEDIDKVMANDLFVEKHLEWNHGNVNKTASGLLFSFKYQKQYKVRQLKASDFPAEIYSIGGMFVYEPDRLGRKTLYFRCKFSPVCKETQESSIQSLLYHHFQLSEFDETGNGYITVADFSGVGISNIDFTVLKAVINMSNIFPNSVPLIIAVNVPTAIRYAINGIKSVFPGDHGKALQILTLEQVHQVIDPTNIPPFLGGSCKKPFEGPECVPKGCLTMRERLTSLLPGSQNNNADSMNESLSIIMPAMDVKSVDRILAYYQGLFGIDM